MGKLLAPSLFFTLLAAFVIVPAFLGPLREKHHTKRPTCVSNSALVISLSRARCGFPHSSTPQLIPSP